MFVGSAPFSNDAIVGAAVDVKPARSDGGARVTLVHGGKLINKTAAAAYLQIFDKPAANVVLGTDVPKLFIALVANESLPLGQALGGIALRLEGTGFSVAATTGPGNAAASSISATLFFE